MEALGFRQRKEAVLRTLADDVIKSSDIEGEKLDEDQMRSLIARRLGMDVAGLVPAERSVEDVVETMLDATQNYAQPLDEERLFGSDRSQRHKIAPSTAPKRLLAPFSRRRNSAIR